MSAILIKIALFLIALNRAANHFNLRMTYSIIMYFIEPRTKEGKKTITTMKEIGMIFITITTIVVPDVPVSKYLDVSEVVDLICNSSVSIIGVLVAIQLLIKYIRSNRKKELDNEREAWELAEDKRKAKEGEDETIKNIKK